MWSCSDLIGSVETDRISNEVLYTQVWSVWRCYCRHLMDPGYCLTVREWERGEYSPETSVCPSIFSFSSPSYLPSPFVVTLLPLLSPFSTSSQAGRGSIPGCSVHYHPETVACDSNCQWLAQASHFSVREVMHTLTHTHTHSHTHTQELSYQRRLIQMGNSTPLVKKHAGSYMPCTSHRRRMTP